MYRKFMIFLEAWKNSVHRKPLILQGARQVGKTWLMKEFGKLYYDNSYIWNRLWENRWFCKTFSFV